MKRAITILLALLLFAAVACTANTTDPTPTQAAELPTEQPTATAAPTEQPTEEPTAEPTEEPAEMKTVQVSTVDEFLAAIAPNTEIVMASGLYNLSTAKDYGKPDETQSPYYTWQRCTYYDVSEVWYELILKGLENLHIIGEKGTVIRNQPKCRQTLTFENCKGMMLSDLTVKDSGDYVTMGGGILCFSSCSDIHIERCDVGGRTGYYIGLIAVSCDGLIVTDSDIHNSGGIQLFECNDILIENSAVRDCRPVSISDGWSIGGYSFGLDDFTEIFTAVWCKNMTVSDCDIYGNYADKCIRFQDQDTVDFSGTSIHDNIVYKRVMQVIRLTIDGCEFKRNNTFNPDRAEPYYSFEEALLINDGAEVCDRDGNRLDNAALKAMELKRNRVSEQQPEATPEPTEEPTPEPTPVEIKTVHVSNVEEFLAAIASNTEIILETGTYDLSEKTLNLKRVNNLSIKAADGATCILTVKDYGTLLTAESCTGLVLSGITFCGDHSSIEWKYCSGVCVEKCKFQSVYQSFSSCEDVKLSDSEVSGSQICTSVSDRITLSNLDIHDCVSALSLSGEDILVTGCRLHDCMQPPPDELWDTTIWISCANVRFEDCDVYGNKCDILFDIYECDLSDVRIYNNDVGDLFCLDEWSISHGHTFTNCEIYKNKIGRFISGSYSDTQVVLSGTSVHNNTIEDLFELGDITVFDCAFRNNTVKCYIREKDDEWNHIPVTVHDPDGNELDEAALKAMQLKRQQPEAAQIPPDATKLPCSTPYWYEVFLDENGKYTLTDVVLFTCDFDGDGTVEKLSCRDVGQAYTFLLDGEAFLTLESVTYVTVIDLDPSTPYLNLIFAKKRTSEAYAKSFEMHLVNGEFVKGATVAACLRWDGEALRGGSIRTDLLGTKDGSRIYAGENFEPQSEWFDCENIPTEEELENNRHELIRRGILLLVKKDLQGTVSGGQPTVIPKGTYVYMTRWHESNTIVKVVTEDGKAVYLSTKVLNWWENEEYVRDVFSKNPDYDPTKYYHGDLINGLSQDVYFDNLFYSD